MSKNPLKLVVLLLILLAACISMKECFSARIVFGNEDASKRKTNETIQMREKAEENGYEGLVDYLEDGASEEDYNALIEVLDGAVIKRGMITLKYDDVSADYNYGYIDGDFSVPYRVRESVKWAVNISIDPNNENVLCRRHHKVEDKSRDAYILICDEKKEYQIIRILAAGSLDEGSTNPNYTKDGFYVLLNNLKDNVQTYLYGLLQKEGATPEDLEQLYEYETKFTKLYAYAQNLEEEDKKEILSLFDSGAINDGIDTLMAGKNKTGYYYTYADSVYSVDESFFKSAIWYHNMEQIEDNTYALLDDTQEAYILLWGEGSGYILVRFIVG